MNKKRNGEDWTSRVDVPGSVTLDFRGLLRGLGDFVDLVGKLTEAGEKHVERHGEFRVKGLADEARGVYGFSIRSGIGGDGPRVRSFGNLHANEDGFVVADVHEPLVDVFDEANEIVVTAELPGVLEDEILVHIDAGLLTIETVGERRYVKDVRLPTPVTDDGYRQTYNNGVLEIRAGKRPAS